MSGINDFNFQYKELVNKMNSIIGSRGPDYTGYTSLPDYSASYNRPVIVNIHVRVNQPYLFENLFISLIREIYNHLELKKLLEQKGYKFKTTYDLKVIIKPFKECGFDLF